MSGYNPPLCRRGLSRDRHCLSLLFWSSMPHLCSLSQAHLHARATVADAPAAYLVLTTRWAVRGGNWVRRTETSLSGGTLLYSVFFNNKPAPLTSHMHYFCTRERDHVHSFLRHIDYCGNIVSHIAVGHSVGDCITELALHTFRITIDRGCYTTAYTTMHGRPWWSMAPTVIHHGVNHGSRRGWAPRSSTGKRVGRHQGAVHG